MKYDADLIRLLTVAQSGPRDCIVFHLLPSLFIWLQHHLQYSYTRPLSLSLQSGFPAQAFLHSLSLLCCWYSVARIMLLTQSKMAASSCQRTRSLFPSPSLPVLLLCRHERESKTFKNVWPWRESDTVVSVSRLQPSNLRAKEICHHQLFDMLIHATVPSVTSDKWRHWVFFFLRQTSLILDITESWVPCSSRLFCDYSV